jgi:4-amino-4-deoxy-L-arabinose transferase-like glycosyltransferase
VKNQIFILIAIIILGFFLRFIDVSNDPPGLYIDEVSIGYNAYSVLTTGKDQFGIPYPLWFRSFGDFKMPLYIYSVVGTMAVFGKTELAVRLPSVLAGTLTILILYLFLDKIIKSEKDKTVQKQLKYLPLLASFLLAISTWHLQFSRGGFEVNLGTLFYLLGCYFYFLFRQNHKVSKIILSVLFFILAIYTYDIFRVLSPIALLFAAIEQKCYKNKKSWIFIIATFVLLLPIILFSLTADGSQRFTDTSAFAGLHVDNIVFQIFTYPLLYISNYFSFFSFDFLFSFGDGIGRHQVQDFGEIYRWQIPFFFAGIYFLLKTKKSVLKYVTFLLFLTIPLAGAVAQPSPHALRSLPLVIPCIIFISVGLLYLIQKIKNHKYKIATLIVIGFFALLEFALYLQFYYINYPQENLPDWGAGYKQLVQATSGVKGKYKYIVVDTTLQYAGIYFDFYDPTIHPMLVPPSWTEPESWEKYPVLYIRPYYGHMNQKDLVQSIYLPKKSPEVFAQFFNLK